MYITENVLYWIIFKWKVFLSLYEENHLGNCFVIQSVNYVSQDMSVLHRCLVPCANQLLVQKTAEILYAYWYFTLFYPACPVKLKSAQ